MGAEHIEFIPSNPIGGVNRFFTTNGRAFFNQGDGCFYLYDSCLIIRINTESWQAASVRTSQPNCLRSITISGGNLHMTLYSGSGGHESLQKALCETEWAEGLGLAAEGVFPSAYKPWVDEQELLR